MTLAMINHIVLLVLFMQWSKMAQNHLQFVTEFCTVSSGWFRDIGHYTLALESIYQNGDYKEEVV